MNTISGQLHDQTHQGNFEAVSTLARDKALMKCVSKLSPLAVFALAVFPAGRVAAQSPVPDEARQQLRGHLRAVTGLGSPQHALIYDLSGVHSFPLYCQGPLKTTSGLTRFKWAMQGAAAANPGPGQCAWANRAPTPPEIKSGGGNVISGTLNQVANLSAGSFAEIGVYRVPDHERPGGDADRGSCDATFFVQ